ncbi:MAG TPA: hypothetical protein ENG70_05200 [Candidatus Cloacimonetes bacterium]|nr:hypothetical protein [Candidatus Cloacimonadota bacterium]HEX38235.1 hypothetical protein [Candidatus Cloacimonadota bacterium]
MKQFICIVGILSVVVSSLLLAEEVDGVAAIVGNQIILQSQVEKNFQDWKATAPFGENISKEEVLQLLIEEKLIAEKAEREDITATEPEIEMQLDRIIQNIIAQFPTYEQFMQVLQQEGLTLDGLKDMYRDQIKIQVVRDKLLQQEVFANLNVAEYEKRNYYETHLDSLPKRPRMVKIAEISVETGVGDKSLSDAYEKIEKIQDELKKGTDFEELAKEYSACPSAAQGGDLGYFARGSMVKEFEDAAFALNVGEVSEPVLTEFGYHLIRVDDIRDGEIKARHILVEVNMSEEDQEIARKMIEDIHSQLAQGADFVELGQQLNDSTGVCKENFSIEEYPVDQLAQIPQFGSILVEIEEGESTDVIELEGAYYIFKNIGYVEPRSYEYQEISSQIEQLVFQEKQQQAIQDWLDELKNEIYVEIIE